MMVDYILHWKMKMQIQGIKIDVMSTTIETMEQKYTAFLSQFQENIDF